MVVPSSVSALSPAPRSMATLAPLIVAVFTATPPTRAASMTVSSPVPAVRVNAPVLASWLPASATRFAPPPSVIVIEAAESSMASVTTAPARRWSVRRSMPAPPVR
ncbi:hypothetical protein CHKEEEPN_3436 [Methylorubrum podarium]|nr:hypothetical protein CHKEEEPN_3436 [Methylorubrum podarium]